MVGKRNKFSQLGSSILNNLSKYQFKIFFPAKLIDNYLCQALVISMVYVAKVTNIKLVC
jgi:hypothetical protein